MVNFLSLLESKLLLLDAAHQDEWWMGEMESSFYTAIAVLPQLCWDSRRRGGGWGVVEVEKQISPLRCSR
jgi:hypothetical protein